MARYIDANVLKEAILKERDAIPLTTTERYSFGTKKPYRDGNSMRGGIRKALRCLEQTPTADVAPIADTVSEIKTRFAMRFGTYTDKDMTPITEVFRLLDQIEKEVLEGGNEN